MTIDRRDFLRAASAGAGLTLAGKSAAGETSPATTPTPAGRAARIQGADIVVVGAGAFGMWTALNLHRLGANVTVVDAYGAGNSRQTSGGETRGVRSSYGDRPHGLLWTRWAMDAMRRWREWDEWGADRLLPQVFFNTGDLILRDEVSPYIEDTRYNWDEVGTVYDVLSSDEVAYRWPWIKFESLAVALYEPGAGVVRARRAIESVAKVFNQEGGSIRIGRAAFGDRTGTRLDNLRVEPGGALYGTTFILALGPWFPKMLPELMGKRLRTSIGHTFYFAVPPGDTRFMYPNMPSYGVPGCTGWPALPPDHRGFRVRTGGRPSEDPDFSNRWIDLEYHERPREILQRYFPDLVGAAINETRACHYESSVDRNFIVDKHPDFENVWLTGGGSAEAFKFGPVLGDYIAKRVLGLEDDPDLAQQFRLKEKEFDEEDEQRRRSRGD
jgi:glycine/D-amino acid oxidase-like deaminating enzyme